MWTTSISFEAAERDALALLDQLCRQPSVAAEETALAETAGLVEQMLRETGFTTQRLLIEGAPAVVYGEQAGRSPYTLLLYNHYDVQPVDPLELWESPPFEPTVRDGKLYARGVADNKGELAVRLAALRALRAAHGELPITIRWVIEGEEEVGSPNFEKVARRYATLLQADACLWEGATASLSDGRPVVNLGFKGMLYVRLEVEVLNSDAHSAVATVLPNAAWRLIGALSAIRRADGRVLLPGFYDDIQEPSAEARRAVAEESAAIEAELRAASGVERFLDDLTDLAFRERAAFAPTCNIAGISSGYAGPGLKTVLPAQATALLDFRLVPDQEPSLILGQLRARLEAEGYGDVEVTPLASAEPVSTPLDHPFVHRVVEVAERFTGTRPSISPMNGGSLPLLASLRKHVGVPGLSPPDNPFSIGSCAHAPNEHIRLDDLSRAVGFTCALMEALGEDAAGEVHGFSRDPM